MAIKNINALKPMMGQARQNVFDYTRKTAGVSDTVPGKLMLKGAGE